MMEKDKLRKADMFSGGIITLFGLWVVSQGLNMPMKGSWGGVQNVWFVSPALFPLFVGAMIALLGLLLIHTALKSVGTAGFASTLRWLMSAELIVFLKIPAMMRFYAIVVLFLSFVFLNIPRVDFFLCSVLFLFAFITMFYFDDDALLKRLLFFFIAGTVCFILYFVSGLPALLEPVVPYPGDWLTLVFLAAYGAYARVVIRNSPELRKKYRLSLILSITAPFLIGPIFKYFLLVPMPTEGLVVTLMDAIRYWDF